MVSERVERTSTLSNPAADGAPAPTITPILSTSRKIMLAFTVLILAYGADQLTKYWVQHSMELGQKIPVLGDFMRWYYILNPGAAFSMGENHTWIFTLIMAIALVVTLYNLLKARAVVWVVTLALLAGGIAGNLTDRLFRAPGFGVGHVVDFISVGNFAIFNIADSCICVSMALLVLWVFRGIKIDGTRAEDHPADSRKNS
ncbi:MAG: signal peptidase II [Rothia sp. (in: high G+C Gram-positive bacteria)]|nr:signal peptidase II [Rothia sp. (in: high G+C Gram-positive bacteria)]